MIRELVLHNRSYRRFHESRRVPIETLRELVDLARLTPSLRNIQPLKYFLVAAQEMCAQVFPLLSWAGYLQDWKGPAEGERPAAYVVVLGDTSIADNFSIDAGIAAQTLLLGAVEKGLGGCIVGSVRREELMALLEIPSQFEVQFVIALGVPAETVTLEPLNADGDIRYWRDVQGVHHVPKRPLADLIVGER